MYLLDVIARATPGICLFGDGGSFNLRDESPPVILCPGVTVRSCDLPSVIAMIAVNFATEIPNLSVEEAHAFSDVRIDMPTEQHIFMKPMVLKQVVTLEKLKIAGTIVENDVAAKNDLIKMEAPSPIVHSIDNLSRFLPV